MKGLLKYLSPFAPDQSGAAAVLFELGGITVICDAGGCTGNICGFDEPRWFTKKSAIFSAGLRDMDAILGRDDRLIAKLKDVADKVDANFAAIIGTPVPAVIATDFRALKRMAQKKIQLPVLALECLGTQLYDVGAENAYLELFKQFADSIQTDVSKEKSNEKILGVLGMTPLDVSDLQAPDKLKQIYKEQGFDKVLCYGMGDGLDAVKQAGLATENLVVSPAGLQAAKYLKKVFGTPYTVAYPLLTESMKEILKQLSGKKVLVVHQQVLANEVRTEISKNTDAEVTVASWFLLKPELKKEKDIQLTTEEQFIEVVESGQYDVIIGDIYLKRALKQYTGTYIHIPHFAVSGECANAVKF